MSMIAMVTGKSGVLWPVPKAVLRGWGSFLEQKRSKARPTGQVGLT